MIDELEKIKVQSLASIHSSKTATDIAQAKSRYIGKNGSLTAIIRGLKDLPPEERSAIGKTVNIIKNEIENAVESSLKKASEINESTGRDGKQEIDITLPGRKLPFGRRHPLTIINDKIISTFVELGFEVHEGPEIELDFFNFEALNIPKDHPARDMHDTFYISDELLLRTHTSPVQIRTMQKNPPPLRIICPGKVYRCDSDVSHTPMFHQIEGLMVDDDITLGDLKGILTIFIHRVFDKNTPIRFRPSFFPFTEPSAEVDIQCVICNGAGCRVCSHTGWLEILGCGMVHPAVFRNVGYNPDNVSGFAFGLGVERIAMLKFGINDIRMFFENDLRFLSQF